jgi:leucyl aminopeptidase
MRQGDAALAIDYRWLAGLGAAGEIGELVAGAVVAGGYDYLRPSADGRRTDVRVLLADGAEAELEAGIRRGQAIGEAINLARDLVNESAVTMTPSRFAEIAADLAGRCGLTIRTWGQDEITAAGMGGLSAVARGSAQPARFLRLDYAGVPGKEDAARPTVALIGKGITFDSGGLSLKSADAMVTMKIDMVGAATVLGAMSALMALEVPGPVRAYLPLTENMPGGAATRPGDVATMRNGLTVEIINTDAEGRLVMADALALAVDEGADRLVDLASLTGACRVALGRQIAGVMGNDDGWIGSVLGAAERATERMWPLPLPDDYKSELDTDVADLRNVGRPVRPQEAGALIAGLFLQDFVAGRPWAHIDMGGPAYNDTASDLRAQGATGFGVRTLLKLLSSRDLAGETKDGHAEPSAP